MSTNDDVNDLLFGGGARAFAFDTIGATVRGEIVSMTTRQQTSIDDNKPLFWDDGRPRMMVVIVLDTGEPTSDDDDGLRSVYLRGGSYVAATGKGKSSGEAVKEAVRKSGAKRIEEGGTLTVQYSGEATGKRGFTPAKLYTASYKAPVSAIDLDELG